uniref:Arf-GAP domain-containing protein n=1 Tax=Globodera rostochiensis TaxID=31243 RepID=A0A914H567_GLORO
MMNEFAAAVCADCGASEPGWASLNHGVLICSNCCYVHRNLGRHISQVRSLTKGVWHDKQLALLQQLHRNGANNVWEHSLIDSLGGAGRAKKKPVSNDPTIPKKEAFIMTKYVQLAFAIRPAKDEFSVDDLNRQLWSCVRTAHIETALRLLALGACPNYADPEKGNTPLHVAAKEGQELQVELLWQYGADVGHKNKAGQTPMELAKTEGHRALSERLVELEHEVTDRFSLFLCGRRPSHKENQHFLIPDLDDSNRIFHVKHSRHSIQKSSGPILERMIQDVYDEVDRRELNAHWNALAAEQHSVFGSNQHVAMFLPPNPRLSATRNQLRQKLAKFSSADFAHLLIDLLKETRRRHFNLPFPTDSQIDKEIGGESSSESVDWSRRRVPTDERFSAWNKLRMSSNSTKHSSPIKSTILDEQTNGGLSSLDYYLELKERWTETNEKIEQFVSSNAQILSILQQLQRTVEQLQVDQANIRAEFNSQRQQQRQHSVVSPLQTLNSSISNARQATPPLQLNPTLPTGNARQPQVGAVVMSTSTLIRPSQQQNKASLLHQYSTDTYPSARMSGVRPPVALNTVVLSSSAHNNSTSQMLPLPPPHHPSSHSTTSMANVVHQKTPKFDAQHRQKSVGSAATVGNASVEKIIPLFTSNCANSATLLLRNARDPTLSQPLNSFADTSIPRGGGRTFGNEGEVKTIFNDEVFPDNLILETELLTNAIKALLSDLQNSPSIKSNGGGAISTESNALFHADSINHHIVHILGVVPDVFMRCAQVQNCALGMESAMKQLSRRCLARPLSIDSTCQAAYDVAKAAKELLVTVHAREEQQR